MRIDAKTGEYTSADNPNAIFELFRVENAPQADSAGNKGTGNSGGNDSGTITEELF